MRRTARPEARSTATVMAVVLTAASGAADALTYSSLGHVFSSAMTGNVALFGIAVFDPQPALLQHVAVGFAGYVAGLTIAGWFVGEPHPGDVAWPRRVTYALVVEFAALVGVLTIWLASGAAPTGSEQFAALGLTAGGLGIQSGAFRAVNVSAGILGSTFITGNLTVWVLSLTQRRPDWSGLISMLALVAGAVLEIFLVGHARPFAGVLPAAVLATVLAIALSRPFRDSNAKVLPLVTAERAVTG